MNVQIEQATQQHADSRFIDDAEKGEQFEKPDK